MYGHPLAGLFWEKYVHRTLLSAGFEKVESWESLYVHKAKKLFLSIYVDDIKLAGIKENLAPMWKLLGSKLDLDPPTLMIGQVYLGCGQEATVLDTKVLHDTHLRWKYITSANTADDATILQQLRLSKEVSSAAPAAVRPDDHITSAPILGEGGDATPSKALILEYRSPGAKSL